MKFIIEHCDSKLYKWSFLEYAHISRIVGRQNLIFTNVKGAAACKELRRFGTVRKEQIWQIPLKKAAVLDPASPRTLTPALARKFYYLIVGGILGDKPKKQRTKKLITDKMKLPSFNLGKPQMPTDTAVHVAYLISKGISLNKMDFVESAEMEINSFSSVRLPFRHLVIDGKVRITPGLIEYLKKRKEF